MPERVRWGIRLGLNKKRQAGHEKDLSTVMAISLSVLTPEPSHVEKIHRPAEGQAPILAQPSLATTPRASYLTPLSLSFFMV